MNFTVSYHNQDKFDHELEIINRKLAKYNLPKLIVSERVPIYGWERPWGEFGPAHKVIRGWEVLIAGSELIVLNGGWQLAGTIDHVENLIREVPGFEIPALYRERGPVCEHCDKARNRNQTIVIGHIDGRLMQLGTACVRDYLGYDLQRMLCQVEAVEKLMSLNDEFEPTSSKAEWDLNTFLTVTVGVIKAFGWLSKTQAQAEGNNSWPTAEIVIDLMNAGKESPFNKKYEAAWSLENAAEAAIVVQWLKNFTPNDSSYELNMKQISENNFVTARSAGFAASAVNMYRKAMEKAAAAAVQGESNWLGAEGDKVQLTVKCLNVFEVDNAPYGVAYLHKFVTREGAVVVWRASNECLDKGVTYTGKATIKRLEERQGIKQTQITRAKLTEVETAA